MGRTDRKEEKGGEGGGRELGKGMHSVASFCLFKLVLNCRVSARGKWNTSNSLRFGCQFPLCTVAKNDALSVQLMRLQLACGCCRSGRRGGRTAARAIGADGAEPTLVKSGQSMRLLFRGLAKWQIANRLRSRNQNLNA